VLYRSRMLETKLAVNTREAARMLSVSPRTIQNYITAKRLHVRKIGRRTVIPMQSLKAFLAADQPSMSVTKSASKEVHAGA